MSQVAAVKKRIDQLFEDGADLLRTVYGRDALLAALDAVDGQYDGLNLDDDAPGFSVFQVLFFMEQHCITARETDRVHSTDGVEGGE